MSGLSKSEKILTGLKILLSFPSSNLHADHDQIWAGPTKRTELEAITPEQASVLESCGWFMDEDVDSWSRFV